MRPKNNLKIVKQKENKKKNEENNILSLPFVWPVGKCETKRKSTKQNPKLSTTFFLHFPLDFTTPDEGKITPEVNESIASSLPLELGDLFLFSTKNGEFPVNKFQFPLLLLSPKFNISPDSGFNK
ncbi:hypothetical protein V6Z11_D09G015700 [Gossypium hirsutum]